MILEVRTYRLHEGRLDAFLDQLRAVQPLLAAAGVDVVRAGASLVGDEGPHAYLIRAFTDLQQRASQEEEFYASSAWRDGPRDAVLGMIVGYHTVVLEVDRAAVERLRG